MKDHPDPDRTSSVSGSDRPGPHVLIVGGGASGVLAAAHILRSDPLVRVTLVEPRDRIGLGLAYSTPDQNHLLNVRAGNMSALADDPRHFLDWLSARGQDNAPDRFVTRRLYGEYLSDLLSIWRRDDTARFRRAHGICTGLTEGPAGIVATFDDGTVQLADHAILATGHSQPRPAKDTAIQPAWDPIPDLPLDASVLILGTGLTMVDQVLSLLDAGFEGRILAISRRGLLPRAHRPTTPLRLGPQDIPFGAPTSALCRWLRTLAREAERKGGTWRDAMDAVRPFVRRIWRSLPPVERARFLRHGQRWWDIHRHRMPPSSEARLLAAMADGQLVLLKGDVLQVDRAEVGILARYRPYRGATIETTNAALAIDARGLRGRPADSPLLARLLDQGTARMDSLGIGLDIANDGSVTRADGTPSSRLSAIGPVSRAAFWEITAIPDIREQAASLAGRIVLGRVP
jgi:uncharacterized NAD(P)/FAD-binding protein YdhS